MSNDKHAYGWSGHILCSNLEYESDRESNLVAIPEVAFRAIEKAMGNLKLPCPIEAEQLGVIDGQAVFIACGIGFTTGYRYYGAPFEEAELRADKHPLSVDLDAEYIKAMKDNFGVELPPCRLMVGCSTEHP